LKILRLSDDSRISSGEGGGGRLLQREWEEMIGNICRIKFYYFRKNTITVQDNKTNKEKHTHIEKKDKMCKAS
jgi:hypothetical protein